jgi:hypothetical protein
MPARIEMSHARQIAALHADDMGSRSPDRPRPTRQTINAGWPLRQVRRESPNAKPGRRLPATYYLQPRQIVSLRFSSSSSA